MAIRFVDEEHVPRFHPSKGKNMMFGVIVLSNFFQTRIHLILNIVFVNSSQVVIV